MIKMILTLLVQLSLAQPILVQTPRTPRVLTFELRAVRSVGAPVLRTVSLVTPSDLSAYGGNMYTGTTSVDFGTVQQLVRIELLSASVVFANRDDPATLTLADGVVIPPRPGLLTETGLVAANKALLSTTSVQVFNWSVSSTDGAVSRVPVNGPRPYNPASFQQPDCQRVNVPMAATNWNGNAIPCSKAFGGPCRPPACLGLTWRN